MTETTEQSDLEGIAAALLRDEPALVTSLDFGDFVQQGVGLGPSLWIGDQVGIPLFTPASVGRYDHRLALLAKPGDVVVVRNRVPEFEAYLDRHLGISGVTYLEADAQSRAPVAAQCRIEPRLYQPLEQVLQAQGALTIQPYLTNGHVWRLASELGQRLAAPVHVAGPGPRIARRCNDKLWFRDLARRVTGAASVPPTWYAFGPAAAAGHVARLVRYHEYLVVKIPGSAGATGNVRIKASRLRDLSLSTIREFLARQLGATGWEGHYPVLVGVWESGVTASPSVQMWIPAAAEAPPKVLGVFEQAVEGQGRAFIGGWPAQIGRDIETKLTDEAGAIASVLQRLGYLGACSFDAALQQGQAGETDLRWIECNGRWTGVSIPMAAAKRISRGRPPRGLVVLQTTLSGPLAPGMAGLVRAVKGGLLKDGAQEGIAILSPPHADYGVSFNAMAIAASQARAEEIAREALERLSHKA